MAHYELAFWIKKILLYADDLLIIITAPPMMAATLLLQCLDLLERFSIFFTSKYQLR